MKQNNVTTTLSVCLFFLPFFVILLSFCFYFSSLFFSYPSFSSSLFPVSSLFSPFFSSLIFNPERFLQPADPSPLVRVCFLSQDQPSSSFILSSLFLSLPLCFSQLSCVCLSSFLYTLPLLVSDAFQRSETKQNKEDDENKETSSEVAGRGSMSNQ